MKVKALKIINPILLVLFLMTLISMLFYTLGSESYAMWHIHRWSGIVFFILGLIHLLFNWGWVRANFLKKKK